MLIMNVGHFGQGRFGLGHFGLGQFGHGPFGHGKKNTDPKIILVVENIVRNVFMFKFPKALTVTLKVLKNHKTARQQQNIIGVLYK